MVSEPGYFDIDPILDDYSIHLLFMGTTSLTNIKSNMVLTAAPRLRMYETSLNQAGQHEQK